MCYIFANNERLKIVTQETSPITINLELSKVKAFERIERDRTEPHLIGFALIHKHVSDKFIIIRYLSDNDETKEIYFAIIDTSEQSVENECLNDICNIFYFVNKHIPKQETNIEL